MGFHRPYGLPPRPPQIYTHPIVTWTLVVIGVGLGIILASVGEFVYLLIHP